jgi:hypothetical protein
MRPIDWRLAIHVRIGLSRRASELAVFDARLDILIRRIDEHAQLCGA